MSNAIYALLTRITGNFLFGFLSEIALADQCIEILKRTSLAHSFQLFSFLQNIPLHFRCFFCSIKHDGAPLCERKLKEEVGSRAENHTNKL